MTRDPAKFWQESNCQVTIVTFLRHSLRAEWAVPNQPAHGHAAEA